VVMKAYQLYSEVRRALLSGYDPQMAGVHASDIVCRATGMTREKLMTMPEHYVSDDAIRQVCEQVDRLTAGEPLAYVLGEWDFYGMTLQVDRNVLIPRDDTVAVTELAIKKSLFLDTSPRILDLCTGSGCIGLAIANRVKDARVTLADISRDALAVAKKNIASQKLTGRVSCMVVDAREEPSSFLGKFDLIVSNPPYVTTEEMEALMPSVKDYEPHLALHGGDDGLVFYRAIADKYRQALKPGGYLCFEFGMGQGDAVCRILEENGYTVLERKKDYNDRERAVLAQYGRKED